MDLNIFLIDVNPAVVDAWRRAFATAPRVEIIHGSIIGLEVDAWVTPTNAHAHMNGGLDAQIKHHLGARVEQLMQAEVAASYEGLLPVGRAVCVGTGHKKPAFLIGAATMHGCSEDVDGTDHAGRACAAALLAAELQNARAPFSIRSIAITGLGTSTGNMDPDACAQQMRAVIDLLAAERFDSFEALDAVMPAVLSDVQH